MLNYLEKSKYVLGLNARNLTYLRPSNSSRAVRIADNKLLTKGILKKAGLPVLETYSIIRQTRELKEFDWTSLPPTFVLKPNRGLGGEGITIVFGRKKKFPHPWVRADRREIQIQDLKDHILSILEGTFSLAGLPDMAFFEERVKLLKLFKPSSFRGIPDSRIIFYH